MKLSKRHQAILALILINIIWGTTPPIFKWSLTDLPPFTLAFLRFFLGALLILPFTIKHLSIQRKDIRKILILALFGIFFNISFFFLGLQRAESINASIVGSGAPVFLIIASIFFLNEKPKRKVILGTLLSLAGVLLIIVQPLLGHTPNHALLGNLLYLLSTFSFVMYTLLLKKYNLPYSALTLTFWVFLFSAVMFFPLFFGEARHQSIHLFSPRALVGIIFGAIGASALGYSLLAFGMKYLKASEVGIFTYLNPIVTALVAIPLLGETITLPYVLGAVLVFGGIFLAEGKVYFHHHPSHPILINKESTLPKTLS